MRWGREASWLEWLLAAELWTSQVTLAGLLRCADQARAAYICLASFSSIHLIEWLRHRIGRVGSWTGTLMVSRSTFGMRYAIRIKDSGRRSPRSMYMGQNTLTPAFEGGSFVHSATGILKWLGVSAESVEPKCQLRQRLFDRKTQPFMSARSPQARPHIVR